MSEKEKTSLPKLNVFVGAGDDNAPTKTEEVADTGAQVTVAGHKHMLHLGIKQHQLHVAQHSLQHAGGNNLEILGSYPIYIVHNNKIIEDEVYFVKGVRNFYLSLPSCKEISIIHEEFPNVNVNVKQEQNKMNINSVEQPEASLTSNETIEIETDPFGRKLPSRPTSLPFPDNEDNTMKLEKWLLNKFQPSCFNIRDPMPHLSKPLNMHLKTTPSHMQITHIYRHLLISEMK